MYILWVSCYLGSLPYARSFTQAPRRTATLAYQQIPSLSSSLTKLTSSVGDHSNASLEAKQKALTRSFVSIGGPAFLQLAAEPLAALVDTAYLGRLGPEVLGGAGVAISAQYAITKLYNDPLLRTSISVVASSENKDSTNAVSSALVLAAFVGIVQLGVFYCFGEAIARRFGLTAKSPMWHSAVSYLKIRALGTPAATLWLVSNGIFRGLGDTRTPLKYSIVFTVLNAILDPLFIFGFKWGASGAAAGTSLAQYIALVPLLRALHRKVPISIQIGQLRDSLLEYVKAGSLVLFRTVGKVSAYAVIARQAALLGSVASAAYNLTFQLGTSTSN